MRGGRKPLPDGVKRNRGTFQPCRGNGPSSVVLPPPRSLPVEPDWLTPAGQEVWLDNLPRVAGVGMADEVDSTAFGNFCNLLGALGQAWKAGEVPPITAIAEMRRMAEMFGLAGPASRGGRP